MNGQRETFIDFAEDWYDRNAGPGETWTLGDLYDALLAAGVLGGKERLEIAWDAGYSRGIRDAESDLEPADNPYRNGD